MNPRNREFGMSRPDNDESETDLLTIQPLTAQTAAKGSIPKEPAIKQWPAGQATLRQEHRRRQTKTQYRTDTEWITSLTGKDGPDAQQLAHVDLSNYLYVVLFNYLKSRRSSLLALASYSDEELITLAQDFVQNYMEKMVKDDYALIEKYSTTGRFTSWVAQVALNMCATEFRRACWSRQVQMKQHPYWDQRAILPEAAAVRSQISEVLEACLAQLPEHYREALVRCIGEGERASVVAADLDISPNAVYILIHRAKNAMRKHLTHAGVGPNSLDI